MASEYIYQVDELGNRIGLIEKLEAHQKGVLHEAFSIFVYNDAGEILLQKRQSTKYHSGGLWSNTCCSHAREEETVLAAATRRLQEEMGFTCLLEIVGSFLYKVPLDNHLIEHEYDYILVGQANTIPIPNPREVSEYRWVSFEHLKKEITNEPSLFTAWLTIIVNSDLIPVP